MGCLRLPQSLRFSAVRIPCSHASAALPTIGVTAPTFVLLFDGLQSAASSLDSDARRGVRLDHGSPAPDSEARNQKPLRTLLSCPTCQALVFEPPMVPVLSAKRLKGGGGSRVKKEVDKRRKGRDKWL